MEKLKTLITLVQLLGMVKHRICSVGDVPKLATLKKGDTIVTGGQSYIFPENIPVGKIDKIFIDKSTNKFVINVRLFNDMTNLGYVYIIENKKRKKKRNPRSCF